MSTFTPVPPSSLTNFLNNNILILDVRPHAAYAAARIPGALSLCVPSTLLKRPLFSLEKLSAMLPSTASRDSFAAWRNASRIIVYDADAAAIPEGSNINGLLIKFKKEGFTGDLGWLQGGFQAVWKTQRHLITSDPPSPDPELDDSTFVPPSGVLRTRHLPMSAFSHSSTTIAPARSSTVCSLALPPPAANPFFDTIRQNTELSHGITERIPLRLPRRVRRRVADLPFRWLQSIALRSASRPCESIDSDFSSEDESEDEISAADVDEGSEALAMQFYRIELAEQRRLQGVMEHHSKECGPSGSQKKGAKSPDFPFSITAGIEKGAKNRYRHIWPFEHARVRLHRRNRSGGTGSPEDDYVNASYVQPLGTNKRYIATQGPLSATFTDFWTLCWEQNVHVIVMLTREVEGHMEKCGNYWSAPSFGPLRLKLLSTSGARAAETEVCRMDFFTPAREPKKASATTIKRVFELTNTKFPASKPRVVTHFQYLEWPDMNVPEDPRGILSLIKEVDAAVAASSPLTTSNVVAVDNKVDSTTGVAMHTLGKKSPVLLHCSAGVGRTGGFIAVDALLDAVRREMRTNSAKPNENKLGRVDEAHPMDVDPPVTGTVPLHIAGHHKHSQSPDGGGGFVVHVPNVGWGADSMRTPPHDRNGMIVNGQNEMETDTSPDDSPSPDSVPVNSPWLNDKPGPSTRRWAEAVSDSTGMIGGGLRNPNANSGSGSNTSSSSISNLPLIPIVSPPHNTRRKQSPTPTDSSSSLPSGHSSDSLGLGSIGADQPSSSVGTTISDDSSGSHAYSVTGAAVPKGANKPRFAQPMGSPQATTANTSNTSSTVGHRRPGLQSSQSSQSMVARSKAGAALGSTTERSSPGSSPYLPPPSSLSSPSRSDLVSDSREPVARCQSSRSESLSKGPDCDGFNTLAKKPLVAESHLAEAFSSDEAVSSSEDAQAIVDYKEPRPLHADISTPALSSYEEPVWQVIHDMREQRMSLCQSLRQYVFVHAALIEGALMIVDEERELSKNRGTTESGSTSVSVSTNPSSQIHLTMPSKRGASPTELLKKDRKGQVSLAKRPSTKRKNSNTEGRDITFTMTVKGSGAAAVR